MNGFYVSLVFFGILLVAISLFCVLLDKRKVFQFSKSFDEKKRELVEIINDAVSQTTSRQNPQHSR